MNKPRIFKGLIFGLNNGVKLQALTQTVPDDCLFKPLFSKLVLIIVYFSKPLDKSNFNVVSLIDYPNRPNN